MQAAVATYCSGVGVDDAVCRPTQIFPEGLYSQ